MRVKADGEKRQNGWKELSVRGGDKLNSGGGRGGWRGRTNDGCAHTHQPAGS